MIEPQDQPEKVLTGGGGGPISAAPLRRERPGGVLIEKVERGKGCAGGGAGCRTFAHM